MDVATEIHAIAKGDREAFSRLYVGLRRPMLAYAMGIVARDFQAAEDVVDEAFLDIWKSAKSYAGTGNAEGWIRRIVRNKAVDWLRKEKRTTTETLCNSSDSRIDTESGPEDKAIAANMSATLFQALQNLSLQQRDAVFLCYYEDRSLGEIAEISQCPENTVKTRLFHARRRLRLSLGQNVT